MLHRLLLLVWIAHLANACDFKNSSFHRPIISSPKSEYIVNEQIIITVRGDTNRREPVEEENLYNLTVKLSIETRLQAQNFIHCLNCDQSLTLQNEFRVFVDRPCEILITPKLFRLNKNGSEGYELPCEKSFLKIRVVKSTSISLTATVFGWATFGLLICSFYPQIIWSFLHTDTSGVCEDYLALSACGFVSSAIFDFSFYFSKALKAEFYRNHPLQQYPARLSDVIFSGHQVFAIALLVYQSLIYHTSQPLSGGGLALLASNLSPMVVLIVFVVLGKFLLIDYVYFADFVRFTSLTLRYLPQITYNMNRASTYGFSRSYLYLDFLGSLFSVLQIILMIINLHDPNFLLKDHKNLTTVGRSFFSMLFDIILFIQDCRLQAHHFIE